MIARIEDPTCLLWTNVRIAKKNIKVLSPKFKWSKNTNPLHIVELGNWTDSFLNPINLFKKIQKVST